MQTSSKQTRMSNEANAINKNKYVQISYRFTHRFFHLDQTEIRNRLKITIDLLGIECMLSAECHIHVAGFYRCNFSRRYPVSPPSPSAQEQWVAQQEQIRRWKPHYLFIESRYAYALVPLAALLLLEDGKKWGIFLSLLLLLAVLLCCQQLPVYISRFSGYVITR